jgi:hypothetical protein
MIELPPPEPDVFYPDGRDQWGHETMGSALSVEAARAYGQACARAALEAAAEVCEAGMKGTESVYADACHNCAALIKTIEPARP